jgi:hypothetical protein
MTKHGNHKNRHDSAFVIGHERFAKISAVEGISLTDAMKQRAEQADRLSLSDEQRREAIIEAHRVQPSRKT